MLNDLENKGNISVDLEGEQITLTMKDFQIVESEMEHIARIETEYAILFMDTTLTPELEAEGLAREIVRRIQSMRKDMDLDVETPINTMISIPKDKQNALEKWNKYISEETRSKQFNVMDNPTGKLLKKWEIDGLIVTIAISS